MKHLLLLLFITTLGFSQENKVEIDSVINVDNTTKDILYARVHSYLIKDLTNQQQQKYLFKVEDKESGIIKIEKKFLNTTQYNTGSLQTQVVVSFNCEVYFKDNRIRVIINDFYHPYFKYAINEYPYPEGTKPKMTGEKWYIKTYTEYMQNVNIVKNAMLMLIEESVKHKNTAEEDW